MKDPIYKPHYGNSTALVIGINAYVHVNPLDIARADAESVAGLLVDELDFPKSKVVILLDGEATRAKIMQRFFAFDSLSPDDRLLVFFAGHGETVDSHRGPVGYLVPVDGKRDDKSTLIRWADLTGGADIIPAKHILFIMDACYSGLAMQRGTGLGEKRFITEMLQRRSRQVITAGKGDEPVADGGGPTGKNSIFTGYLLEGLRGAAANGEGVMTASYLMNYVYRKVSTDARSKQTPHFGHIDGDGDFILRTPHKENLFGGASGDFLVKPVTERPEQLTVANVPSKQSRFAEKNGYADPGSSAFGQNEWSTRLGILRRNGGIKWVKSPCWLGLVVEPVSDEAVALDILSLAKTLPNSQTKTGKPYEQFRMPSQSRTTANSVILFEPESPVEGEEQQYWKRFLRIEKDGTFEYCTSAGVARLWLQREGQPETRLFKYVQLIGVVWSFLYAAKRILDLANYQAGIRYLVNLVGTKDSLLTAFAPPRSSASKYWLQPTELEAMEGGALQNWRCHDPNLQFSFLVALASLGEQETKKLIVDCADGLGLAYNHQSEPRCFYHGTDLFPWEQFAPNEA